MAMLKLATPICLASPACLTLHSAAIDSASGICAFGQWIISRSTHGSASRSRLSSTERSKSPGGQPVEPDFGGDKHILALDAGARAGRRRPRARCRTSARYRDGDSRDGAPPRPARRTDRPSASWCRSPMAGNARPMSFNDLHSLILLACSRSLKSARQDRPSRAPIQPHAASQCSAQRSRLRLPPYWRRSAAAFAEHRKGGVGRLLRSP